MKLRPELWLTEEFQVGKPSIFTPVRTTIHLWVLSSLLCLAVLRENYLGTKYVGLELYGQGAHPLERRNSRQL